MFIYFFYKELLKVAKMPTALNIQTEKCGKCEKPVFEAEGFPAGTFYIF